MNVGHRRDGSKKYLIKRQVTKAEKEKLEKKLENEVHVRKLNTDPEYRAAYIEKMKGTPEQRLAQSELYESSRKITMILAILFFGLFVGVIFWCL